MLAFLGVCWYNYKKLQVREFGAHPAWRSGLAVIEPPCVQAMKARQAAAASSASSAKLEEQSPLVPKGIKSPSGRNDA